MRYLASDGSSLSCAVVECESLSSKGKRKGRMIRPCWLCCDDSTVLDAVRITEELRQFDAIELLLSSAVGYHIHDVPFRLLVGVRFVRFWRTALRRIVSRWRRSVNTNLQNNSGLLLFALADTWQSPRRLFPAPLRRFPCYSMVAIGGKNKAHCGLCVDLRGLL